MNSEPPKTCYAPAERLPADRIAEQAKSLESLHGACSFFDALPNVIMVLNFQRQVIFCNKALLDLLGIREHEALIGLRPGEILRCIHACETAGGCGTTESCRTCCAINAILESQHGRKA
ncbi:MAG: PAS domain-containing protein, partial [Firmicutes bacterium]|nr:PAS domain-containing protein [Bacillota bacterium]